MSLDFTDSRLSHGSGGVAERLTLYGLSCSLHSCLGTHHQQHRNTAQFDEDQQHSRNHRTLLLTASSTRRKPAATSPDDTYCQQSKAQTRQSHSWQSNNHIAEGNVSPEYHRGALIMVQFKQHWLDEAYWKLDYTSFPTGQNSREYLRSKGYSFNKTSSAARMRVHKSRADRGLMSYEKLSMSQLKYFCAGRKIPEPKYAKLRLPGLVELLENEDENETTFGRFMELPPELRLHVYAYYFESMLYGPPEGTISSQNILQPPPLAQVSSQIRQETLPLFSDFFRFQLSCDYRAARPNEQRTFIVDRLPSRSLSKAPHHLLEMVRHVSFSSIVPIRGFQIYASWDIAFPKGEKPLKVDFRGLSAFWSSIQAIPDQLRQEVQVVVGKHLKAFLEGMAARPEGMALRRKDEWDICRVLAQALQELEKSPS